jgi:Family of unknown function (DUF6209)
VCPQATISADFTLFDDLLSRVAGRNDRREENACGVAALFFDWSAVLAASTVMNPSRRLQAVFGVVVLGFGFGCGRQEATVVEPTSAEGLVAGPLLGAGGHDAADRGCQVVLRRVDRGETSCTAGLCWWTFQGTVDVSSAAVAEQAAPKVLFKSIDATSWSVASATATTGAPVGFVRYAFSLQQDTIRDGMSATAYARANVQVVPFLLTSGGARVFDHNRVPGALDAYVVNQAGGWAIGEDAAACRGDVVEPRALDFQLGYRVQQRGAVVALEPLSITYAIERLPTCRGTHNGFPAWDLRAFVRFNPSGVVVDGTVRGFDAPNGVPNNAGAKGVPFVTTVPGGTTSLDVWFQNADGAGGSCVAWDSNFGHNYHFEVVAAPLPQVGWVGHAGSSFSRLCQREDGVPATVTMDSYLQQRACAFVEVDVYAPQLTDWNRPAGWLFAQAELERDGVALPTQDLSFVGRFGNDHRFHFEVPKSDLYYGPKWQTFRYTLRFSTDGRTWLRDGPRTVVRDVSFCNPAWGGC